VHAFGAVISKGKIKLQCPTYNNGVLRWWDQVGSRGCLMFFSPLLYCTPQLEYHHQISQYWTMCCSFTRITPAFVLLFSSIYSEFFILLPGSCSSILYIKLTCGNANSSGNEKALGVWVRRKQNAFI